MKGIVGTFLALPVAAAINVALHEFFPEELGALPGDVAVASGTSPVDPMAAVQPATQSPVEAPSDRFTGQG